MLILLKFIGVTPTPAWIIFFHALDSLVLGILTAVAVAVIGYLTTATLTVNLMDLTHIAEAAAVGAFVKGYPTLVQPFENAVEPEITKKLPAIPKFKP